MTNLTDTRAMLVRSGLLGAQAWAEAAQILGFWDFALSPGVI
jgi:hypothetical protein